MWRPCTVARLYISVVIFSGPSGSMIPINLVLIINIAYYYNNPVLGNVRDVALFIISVEQSQ